jgi:hypothetical protein
VEGLPWPVVQAFTDSSKEGEWYSLNRRVSSVLNWTSWIDLETVL